jgi:hypothetical protein
MGRFYQSCVDVAEMDAQRASAAFRQHVKVPSRLRRLHDAETVSFARYGDVGLITAGDLQEHVEIRAALVER